MAVCAWRKFTELAGMRTMSQSNVYGQGRPPLIRGGALIVWNELSEGGVERNHSPRRVSSRRMRGSPSVRVHPHFPKSVRNIGPTLSNHRSRVSMRRAQQKEKKTKRRICHVADEHVDGSLDLTYGRGLGSQTIAPSSRRLRKLWRRRQSTIPRPERT